MTSTISRAMARATMTISAALMAGTLAAAVTPTSAAQSLVHDGDRWVCLGDSITAFNCYPPLLARVFAHYHPDATLTIVNSGHGGDTASADPKKLAERVLQYHPTIVSVMYGMNEAINLWGIGQPKEPIQENYRAALTAITRTLRAQGITVLLMSPSPTDVSTHAYFALDKTDRFLAECADIVRSVAQAEGAHYVPVHEAFTAFQADLPRGVALTGDGVHPSALGQYCIARALWQACGFAKPLSTGSDRPLQVERDPPPQVTVRLGSRFVSPGATGLELRLDATSAQTVEVTWSVAQKLAHQQGNAPIHASPLARGAQTLELVAGANTWTLPLAQEHVPSDIGRSADILLDLRVGDQRQLCIIDLSRTRVLHFKEDKVSGSLESELARPEGKRLATWEAQRLGDRLAVNIEVFDRELVSGNEVWPFSRDGLNLMFDFRPKERFADIGVDREVTQLFVNVRDEPFFATGLRAWTGWGMDFSSYVAASRTSTGYTIRLLMHDHFDLRRPAKLSDRDFIGLLVAVGEHATVNGAVAGSIVTNQHNDAPVYLYANNLMILDLRDQLPGDQVINAHLTTVQAP
ncbi:MAG: hypothetical protein H0W72_03500 [Planctomycetes bacterium]|nr:hypothetical protein [Planctomycetota bacterium]